MESIIRKIREEVEGGHKSDSSYAKSSADNVEEFIRKKVTEYSEAFGFPEERIMEAIEKIRNYSAANYYQEANFPSLDKVTVFETEADLQAAVPNKKFRCSACGGITTNPYECNSGKEIEEGKVCDWKTYGLFRTMGLGLRFTIKTTFLEKPFIDEIFMPIDLEEQKSEDGE